MALRITSCMSEANDPVCFEIADYLAARTGVALEFVEALSWPERLDAIAKGRIEIGWICSLPYVMFADDPQCRIELLGVPVMAGPQYEGQPVYFSDVAVRANSSCQSFNDLLGSRFTFNETGSRSGFYIMVNHLIGLGTDLDFFGEMHPSGAHTQSVQRVLDGNADCAAIDSMVLDALYSASPELKSELKAVERLGPNPVPPWIISSDLDFEIREQLRESLLGMAADPEGRALLARGGMQDVVALSDRDYDSVRQLQQSVESFAASVDLLD